LQICDYQKIQYGHDGESISTFAVLALVLLHTARE